jgi:uncharacterized protein with PIN domain
MIESLGVPHPEVEAIVVDGGPVDFSYIVQDGDRVDVYPASIPSDTPALPLRPPIPGRARFVLDTHLGQLAAYLRMLGFDTLYRNDYPDDELALISSEEQRILLTRDLGLLKRGIVAHGYYVRETDPRRQMAEILRRYQLAGTVAPFQRCIRCNGRLRTVQKANIADRLAPKTREYYQDFSMCDICDQVYWKGSHYDRMRQIIEGLLRNHPCES